MRTAIMTGIGDHTGGTPGWGDALITMLFSLSKNCSYPFDLYVYHRDVHPDYIKIVKRIFYNVKLIYNERTPDLKGRFHSGESVCKFQAFNLLKTYDQVIWLDADITFNGPVTGLIKYNRGFWASRESWYCADLFTAPVFCEKQNQDNFCSHLMFNSGVMVFNKDIPHETAAAWCLDMIERHKDKLNYFDQAIFNLWAYSWDVKINTLPDRFSGILTDKIKPGQVIYHHIKHPKPWEESRANWFKWYYLTRKAFPGLRDYYE